jgi:hypothetical protein
MEFLYSLLALLRRLNELIPAAKGELQSSSEVQQRAGGCHQERSLSADRAAPTETNRVPPLVCSAERYWFKLSGSFPYSALHTAQNLFASSLYLSLFCLFPREQLLFHLQKRQPSECLCMRAFTSARSFALSQSDRLSVWNIFDFQISQKSPKIKHTAYPLSLSLCCGPGFSSKEDLMPIFFLPAW